MNIKPAPVLVLFDLVSTITDAGPRYAEAYTRIAAKYGIAQPDRGDILRDLGNHNLKEIIARHSPGLPQEKLRDFMADCNNACDSLLYDVHWVEKLFAHVHEALSSLKVGGCTIGLYTGTREDAMEAQLRYHNLRHYFDPQLVRGKDNARDGHMGTQQVKIAQLNDLAASFRARHNGEGRVIVVGDSVSDYHAARESGAVFVGFAENWRKAQDMKEAGVGTTFDDFAELPAIVAVIAQKFPPANALRQGFNPARGIV